MIKVLSDDTIQKIAAGEVVERPSSIVKELVENSIDANATHITVEIKEGGKSYIKVSDNGHGIEKDDLALAFTRHATSKINSFEDLYKIYSMGFRGEALASIVSVAKISLKTRTENDIYGTSVNYDNNKLISETNIGMNVGTIIEVYDLFSYIPVRKKFLSSDITESNKISNLMYSFAIGHPEISFTYIKDNREIFKTIISDNKNINNEILFGKDFVKNSIDIDLKSQNYSIKGTVSNNKYYKGNRSMQYIYVNGRYIENEQIVDAIEQAYYNLIPSGRFPIFEIKISVDPNLIDINIHPNKQKIKFTFNEELINLLKNSIMDLLYQNEITKNIVIAEEKQKIKFHDLNHGDGYKRILDLYKNPIDYKSKEFTNIEKKEENKIYSEEKNKTIILNDLDKDLNDSFLIDEILNNKLESKKFEFSKNDILSDIQVLKNERVSENQVNFIEKDLNFKTIILNKYILFEDIENNKLIFIDIIRANERILYDRHILNKNIISQDLIEPYILNLTSKELEIFIQNQDYFTKNGYEVEQFTDSSIIVRSIPYFFDKPTTKEDLHLLIDELSSEKKENRENFILRKSLSMAINKKTNLSESESIGLYKELIKSSNKNTSPHGKPIIFEITNEILLRILK